MLRLKELRALSKETQQEVADAIDIERSLYVRYEYGSRIPPLKNLIKLADHFNVTLDYLSRRSDDPSPIKQQPTPNESITDIATHANQPMTKKEVQALVRKELLTIKKELENIKKGLSD